MKLEKQYLGSYLGKSLGDLEGKVRESTLKKLKNIELQIPHSYHSVIDYLFLEHQQNRKSLRELAKELGITHHTVKKILDIYDLPTLTKAEAIRENWEDPEFRKRNAEAIRENWEDPEFRKRNAEAIRENWEDPEFRKRQAEGVRKELHKRWEDPEFRKRQAEGVREVRLNPENIENYKLPTIHGNRNDIGYAQSAWEANFARVLLYCDREFIRNEKFRLEVKPELKYLFKSDVTDLSIDFVVKDKRGELVLYEIVAHPGENPVGFAKLEMLIEQYPVEVRTIGKRYYRRLEKHFKDKIESHQDLSGWETGKDNLKTNPEKYGVNQNEA